MDLKIVETYDGGDVVKTTKDLKIIYGLSNMPYLALFGGCVEASTPTERIASEQNFDWWGNDLLMRDNRGLQFNSETERALKNIPLTSAGRQLIEQAVIRDLQHMKELARIGVSVVIIATDVVRIGIRVEEPDNLEQRDFIFIWDATRGELVEDLPSRTISFNPQGDQIGLDYTLDFTFL